MQRGFGELFPALARRIGRAPHAIVSLPGNRRERDHPESAQPSAAQKEFFSPQFKRTLGVPNKLLSVPTPTIVPTVNPLQLLDLGDAKPSMEPFKDIAKIERLVEDCFEQYLSEDEIIDVLETKESVLPSITRFVLMRLEQQNPKFFTLYRIQQRMKQQILEFNDLVSQQAVLVDNARTRPSTHLCIPVTPIPASPQSSMYNPVAPSIDLAASFYSSPVSSPHSTQELDTPASLSPYTEPEIDGSAFLNNLDCFDGSFNFDAQKPRHIQSIRN